MNDWTWPSSLWLCFLLLDLLQLDTPSCPHPVLLTWSPALGLSSQWRDSGSILIACLTLIFRLKQEPVGEKLPIGDQNISRQTSNCVPSNWVKFELVVLLDILQSLLFLLILNACEARKGEGVARTAACSYINSNLVLHTSYHLIVWFRRLSCAVCSEFTQRT